MAFHVEQDGGEIVIRVRVDAEPSDMLVAIAKEPLEKLGLEYAPILALADAGTLKTITLGRRRHTKLSYILALVDTLPAAKATDEEDDPVLQAARKRAARVAR